MGCINRLSDNYIKLANRYGEDVTNVLIRTNPKNRNTLRDENFYIPSISEVNKIIKSKPGEASQKLVDKLEQNPYMNIDGIASLLRGVINKKKNTLGEDVYLITKGDTSGILQREISNTEVYRPNLKAMRFLERKYPDIFELQSTRNDFTYKVIITPRIKETAAQEEATSFSIQNSLDTYRSLTERLGYSPISFEVGNHRWVQTNGSLYNLINKFNYTVLERNVNLQSGAVQERRVPVNEKERNMMIGEVQELKNVESINIALGLKGYFIEDILDQMRNAGTQQELMLAYKKILKTLC